MQNPYQLFRGHVVEAVTRLGAAGAVPAGLDTAHVAVEPPRDPSHGDLATNAAMVLAKPAGQKPRDLAERIAAELRAVPGVTKVEIAGPGFINLRLTDQVWRETLRAPLRQGVAYGDAAIGRGQRVNVEYVSANPTGPLHVGHCRGAVFGDALSALLEKAGYGVVREYYVNDAGAQVDVLARSTYLRYREALGHDIGTIPEGLYPGDYLKPVGAAIAAEEGAKWHDQPESAWLDHFRARAIEAMMALIREDLAVLGIAHEVFTSERALQEAGGVEKGLKILEDRGLLYTGVLEPPKGKTVEDWEPRPQLLFASTRFGDDVDRAVRKSDGSWTYFAGDVANHADKIGRGFTSLINVFGADHGGYVKRLKAAVAALSESKVDLDIKVCQLVNLLDRGQPVRMSKRSGSFVTLRDVVDEVGRGVVRFIMLTRRNDAPLDFDFAKVTEQSKDNPVFYVQYAHARAHSVLRGAVAELPEIDVSAAALASQDLSPLAHPAELALIKLIAGWPRTVESAALAHEPHRIAFYLTELAAAFHGLWNQGKDDDSLRFIRREDRAVTLARLALVRALATTIASGLAVLGVEPLEEMR
ncbi:arginine--tRNA ligase [Desertibaculum subflavum]|uniref:arginine--tRNA ligase n=1 Tax=Desertibaculum subflavum TaxID=2268458 RepID=UPI000E66BF8F